MTESNNPEHELRNFLNTDYCYGFDVEYRQSNSILNLLCEKHGSDKGKTSNGRTNFPWPHHSYADVYELLFALHRDKIKHVLECGIGTTNPDLASSMGVSGRPGASLRVWRDYFPNAQVIGIDIDPDTLFSEHRIETYQCDQTDSNSIQNFIREAGLQYESLEIIIDDGLHTPLAATTLLASLFPFLSVRGFYIIEDVGGWDYKTYKEYFLQFGSSMQVRFFNLARPNLEYSDNRLIVISKPQK